MKSPALRYPETGLEEIIGDLLEADLNEAAGAAGRCARTNNGLFTQLLSIQQLLAQSRFKSQADRVRRKRQRLPITQVVVSKATAEHSRGSVTTLLRSLLIQH